MRIWIPKIIRAVIYVRYWCVALEYARKEKYEESLKYLGRCFWFKHKNPRPYFLRGFLVVALKGSKYAIDDFTQGLELAGKNTRFNSDEVEYMRAYATNMLEIDRCPYDSSVFHYNEFDIKNVCDDILYDFPLGEGERLLLEMDKAVKSGGIRKRSQT